MSFLLRYDCENSRWKNKSHSLFLFVNLLQLQVHLSCIRFMLILLKVLLQYSRWENGRQRQTFKLLLLLLCSYLFQMFVDPFCESFLLYCISLVWKRGKINCVFSTSKYLKCSRNPFIGQNFSENLRLILLLALKFKKLLKWCKSRGLWPWISIIWNCLTKYFPNCLDCLPCQHQKRPGIVTVKTNFFLYHNIMKCVSKILISNLLCCGKTDSRLQFVIIFTIRILLIIWILTRG